MKKLFQLTLISLAVTLGVIALEASSATQFVYAEPADAVRVKAGASVQATLRFQVAEGYHINSHKPNSDVLIPTELKLDVPPDLALGNFSYPAGSELSLSFDPSAKLNVYTGEFAVRATIHAPASAAAGTRQVRGELDYQACSDRACYPPKKLPVSFDVMITKPQS